jgi:carboxyl-terminal processing protease
MGFDIKRLRRAVLTPRRRRYLYLRNIVIVGVVFLVGLGIGDGRISFSNNSNQLSVVATGLPNSLNYSSVNQVYRDLVDNYDGKLTQTQLLNGLKQGLAESTNDPYTEYFTAQEAKAFNGELNNSFSGIGAELGANSSGDLEVIAPISGSPAEKAGLKPQDIISEINGVSTASMSMDSAVDKIRGPQGTQVRLQVIRNDSQTLNFTITRKNINLPSVNTKILNGDIGYMQISTFADDTTSC